MFVKTHESHHNQLNVTGDHHHIHGITYLILLISAMACCLKLLIYHMGPFQSTNDFDLVSMSTHEWVIPPIALLFYKKFYILTKLLNLMLPKPNTIQRFSLPPPPLLRNQFKFSLAVQPIVHTKLKKIYKYRNSKNLLAFHFF